MSTHNFLKWVHVTLLYYSLFFVLSYFNAVSYDTISRARSCLSTYCNNDNQLSISICSWTHELYVGINIYCWRCCKMTCGYDLFCLGLKVSISFTFTSESHHHFVQYFTYFVFKRKKVHKYINLNLLIF